MSNRSAVRFAVRCAILGTAAATLAGYGGYAMLPSRAVSKDPAAFAKGLESQIPNRAVKTDRLADVIPAKAAAAEGATYTLASASSSTEYDHAADAVTAQAPARIQSQPVAAPKTASPQAELPKAVAKLAALPAPVEKPRHALPPPPPAPEAFLDDAQIAGIKTRLRLSADQAEYWPAVESALREVVHKQFRGIQAKHARGVKPSIDTNAPEVQKLIYAAMPLLMRLREDQKHEVRKLARVIGLEQVASQI